MISQTGEMTFSQRSKQQLARELVAQIAQLLSASDTWRQ
jgi:hypothetical protein